MSTSSWCSVLECTLFQIASSLCRTCVHVSDWSVGISLETHAGTLVNTLPLRKWFNVIETSFSMLLLMCVSGLASTRLSVSTKMVENMFHVNFADPRFKRRAHLTICMRLSRTPAKWRAEDRFRKHSINSFRSYCLMNSWSGLRGCLCITFLAPRKLLPLPLK